ncbi:rabphilin-3A isoform X2 [Thrips palmi]|uniref:Rabphilin-3A isoform X2 n=1 Tax=Thrips palmi TaxID=161013 RepID=A0A6P8YI94_THRPL|nr:rabphilin-3A isoform X2 [Thrips palmi]
MDCGDSAAKHRWVCPSDRHLALRAKLRTGWSVKTQPLESLPKAQEPTVLDDTEQAMILEVIRRAEHIDLTEQERVGRLVDRVDNMKRNAMGNGSNQCVLCGTKFGFLGSTSYLCHDCQKFVCSKCSIETSSSSKDQIWLCKICSETREMWKKSGAWFFKGLPKYVLPEKPASRQRPNMHLNSTSQHPATTFNSTWAKHGMSGETENDSSSEDELMRRSRLNTGASVASAASALSATSVGSALSAASIASAVSAGSSHSGLSNVGKLGAGNSGTSFARDNFSRKSSHIKVLRSPSGLAESGTTATATKTLSFPVPDKVDSPIQNNSQNSHRSNFGLNIDENSFLTQSQTAILHGTPQVSPQESLHHRSSPTPITWHNNSQRTYSFRRLPGLSRSWRDWQAPLLSSDEISASSDCLRLPRSVSGHTIAAAKPDDIPTLLGAHGSAQLGSVELSLLYDRHSGCLHCRLLRAKGLKSTDINGLADPFCKLNLLPIGNKNNRLRTQTIHKTCNPEFNESLTFYNVTDSDMATKALHILVLDDDKYGHDFLGEARIQLSGVPPQHARHFKVFLDKHYPVEDEEAAWGEDLWTRGQILVTLCYSTKRRALIVGIVRCLNLTPMDSNGSSDPFVKLQLKPDTHHRKYKTGIKWQSLNPLFNEEFVFDTKMTELQQKTLVITVWDKDHGKSNDYLGGLELSCLSKGERLRHWVDAIKFPDHKHEGWHQLVDTPLPM